MKDFIIFFDEKEGSTALVHLLNKFDDISIVHSPHGWEPFDRHQCGAMSLNDLQRCLEFVFTKDATCFDRLLEIYTKTNKLVLQKFHFDSAVGFKMRFTPPWPDQQNISTIPPFNWFARLFFEYRQWVFKNMIVDFLPRRNIAVFLAVRQDILKWALSKYHGDGTGNAGHLQFKMAKGEIGKNDVSRLHVDCSRLAAVVSKCERIHARKCRIKKSLNGAGIDVHVICYEEFLNNKERLIRRILEILEVNVSREQLDFVLGQEQYFKKVHSDEIADFVENHDEVTQLFGDRFVSWS